MLDPFIIGAVSNAIRGGQWRAWLGLPPEYKLFPHDDDVINALIFAVTTGVVTGNWWLALASFPAMWIGAAPAWGDYIGAVGGWRTTDLKANRFIDKLIRRLMPWPKLWGWAGLSIRGVFWGACLSVPFWVAGLNGVAGALILNGLFIAPAYWSAIAWMWLNAQKPEKGWGLGEIFFGAILWSSHGGI